MVKHSIYRCSFTLLPLHLHTGFPFDEMFPGLAHCSSGSSKLRSSTLSRRNSPTSCPALILVLLLRCSTPMSFLIALSILPLRSSKLQQYSLQRVLFPNMCFSRVVAKYTPGGSDAESSWRYPWQSAALDTGPDVHESRAPTLRQRPEQSLRSCQKALTAPISCQLFLLRLVALLHRCMQSFGRFVVFFPCFSSKLLHALCSRVFKPPVWLSVDVGGTRYRYLPARSHPAHHRSVVVL